MEEEEPDGLDVFHSVFTGVVTGAVLYVLAGTPPGLLLTAGVFWVSGCCLHRSWDVRMVFLASLLVMGIRLSAPP